MKRYLLALDFDLTITVKDRLNKSRATRLARTLRRLKQRYDLDVFILSVANFSHILYTVMNSKSTELLKELAEMTVITNETDHLIQIDPRWHEDKKGRKAMIQKITHGHDENDYNKIIAYKKTNYLLYKSKEEKVPHSHIFFLDDNQYNIAFARYYGFQTFMVNNQIRSEDLFERLKLVENLLKKEKSNNK